jgi:hypothetical protein
VFIQGALTPKVTIAAGVESTMFTLPAGFRPNTTLNFKMQGTGQGLWLLSITTTGAVTMSRYAYNFQSAGNQALTGDWFPMACSFVSA